MVCIQETLRWFVGGCLLEQYWKEEVEEMLDVIISHGCGLVLLCSLSCDSVAIFISM